MFIVANAPNLPATVTGSGTAAQTFTPQLLAPGSSRLDGQQFQVRFGGTLIPNTASTAKVTVFANYPNLANGAAQYPLASITSAIMTNNVATYNGANNFVPGQYVTVANIANANLSGSVGPILTANANAFTASNIGGATLAIANIANAAQTATAVIAPLPVYTANVSPTLTTKVAIPFQGELTLQGDSKSGIILAFGTDKTVNVNASANGTPALVPNVSTGTVVPVPGVNFANEPPVFFTIAETFGSSDAGNSAVLKNFFLES